MSQLRLNTKQQLVVEKYFEESDLMTSENVPENAQIKVHTRHYIKGKFLGKVGFQNFSVKTESY